MQAKLPPQLLPTGAKIVKAAGVAAQSESGATKKRSSVVPTGQAPLGATGLASQAKGVGSVAQVDAGALGVLAGGVAPPLPERVSEEISQRFDPDLKGAERIWAFAFEVQDIDDYHIGDLQYGRPLEQMEKVLERMLARVDRLQSDNGAHPDLRRVEDDALGKLAVLVERRRGGQLAEHEARPTLSKWNRDSLEWTRHGIDVLGKALSTIQKRGDDPPSAAFSDARDCWQQLIKRTIQIGAKPPPGPRPAGKVNLSASSKIDWSDMNAKTLAVWQELLPKGLELSAEHHDHLTLLGAVASKVVSSGLKALTYKVEGRAKSVETAKTSGEFEAAARHRELRDGAAVLLLESAVQLADSWAAAPDAFDEPGPWARMGYGLLADKTAKVASFASAGDTSGAVQTANAAALERMGQALDESLAAAKAFIESALHEAAKEDPQLGGVDSELMGIFEFLQRHFADSASHAQLTAEVANAYQQVRTGFSRRDLTRATEGLPRLQAAQEGDIPQSELRTLYYIADAMTEAAESRERYSERGVLSKEVPPEEAEVLAQLAPLCPQLRAELDRLNFDPHKFD